MTEVRFAVLRHAPTEWNRLGRLQGRADVPLDAAGCAAALTWRLPEEVAGWPCLTSPLRRAVETASLLGLDASPEPALIETDWGEWEGSRLADLRRQNPAVATLEAAGLDLVPPGGESPRQVQARLLPLLARLAARGVPALAVTHKGVMRALLSLATGWDMTGKPPIRLDWNSIHVFALHPNGQPRFDHATSSIV
jgi:broad specificity phosphatase PhoE